MNYEQLLQDRKQRGMEILKKTKLTFLKIITIEHNCRDSSGKVCLLTDEIKSILKKYYPKDKIKVEVVKVVKDK